MRAQCLAALKQDQTVAIGQMHEKRRIEFPIVSFVAVANLIPGLHKHAQLRDTLEQVGLIVLGVATVGGMLQMRMA